jgi:signal transduction histidine kinase
MNDGRSLFWLSWALVPAYLLLVGLLAKVILKAIPDGKLKRLLSRRIDTQETADDRQIGRCALQERRRDAS